MILPAGNRVRILLMLLGTLLVLVAIEGLAYLALRRLDPGRARRTLARHAWVGRTRAAANNADPLRRIPGRYPFHPLFGWYPRKDDQTRDRFGYRPDASADTVSLRPETRYRIYLLGGSTVEGPGLSPDRTLSAHLERTLRTQGVNANVINAGVGGWYSSQELALLTGRILPFFSPDLVIVLDGFNDAGTALAGSLRSDTPPRTGPPPRSLHDPNHEILVRYRQQMRGLHDDPGFLVGQLLSTLGLRRYFYLPNYFAGQLPRALFPREPSTAPQLRRFQTRLEHLRRHGPIALSASARRRAARRVRSLKPKRRARLTMAMKGFSRRDRRIVRRRIAGMSEHRWNKLRYILSSSTENVRSVLRHRVETYLPDGLNELLEKRRCRDFELNTEPYLRTLRTARGSTRGHGVPFLHVLQPILPYKNRLTLAEEQMLRRTRIKSYLGQLPRLSGPRVCLVEEIRDFFEESRPRLAALRGDTDASVPSSFLDLSRLFRGESRRIFTDVVHYNERGNRLIARALARKIRRMDARPGVRSGSPAQDSARARSSAPAPRIGSSRIRLP